MKQFGTILKFELKNYFSNKIFTGITVFLVAVIAIIMFFPRITAIIGENGSNRPEDTPGDATADTARPVMLIAADFTDDYEFIRNAFANSFTEYDVRISDNDLNGIKEQISSGETECAFVIDSLTSYTYYVGNLSMYDANTDIADAVLIDIYRKNELIAQGVSAQSAEQILSASIEHQTQNLGKNQMENFFYTYIMIFALYMVILFYGQMIATNVATEKSSRAMEVLITSAKPVAMMFGKVIASCVAGFIQLVCIFGSAVLFYNLNKPYWGGNMIIDSIFNIPVSLLLYMLLFFVLGFFIYAFMFGAVGSVASKLEDINTSSMPITLIFIIAFIVVMMSMSSGEVDSVLMRICSYIPFTSPMAMFTRIAMSTVPAWEIIISIGILLVSTTVIGVLAAKIYRVGVLLYGTTPKIGSVLKSVLKA